MMSQNGYYYPAEYYDRIIHNNIGVDYTAMQAMSPSYITKQVLPQRIPVMMTVTPETVLPTRIPAFNVNEPIEAGSKSFKMSSSHLTSSSSSSSSSNSASSLSTALPKARRSSCSASSSAAPAYMNKEFIRSLPFQRPGLTWETMTDEEREEAQRLKRKDEAYKTSLCEVYKRTSVCSYGESCRFAHGEHELRLPSQQRGKAHPKYKTQLCDKFSMYGTCPYGQRCQFIHKLKKGLPVVEYERMLALGRVSPALDDDDHLGCEASRAKSGWQPMRLDVLPPAASQRPKPKLSKEKTQLPYRHSEQCEYDFDIIGHKSVSKRTENSRPDRGVSFEYDGGSVRHKSVSKRTEPERALAPPDRELAFERAWKEAAAKEKLEEQLMRMRKEREEENDRHMKEMKRRQIEEATLRMKPQFGRSASLQTLAESEDCDRSSNVRDIKGVNKAIEHSSSTTNDRLPIKAPRKPELSLIQEESEEQIQENLHHFVAPAGHWQEILFGKKLQTIAEENEDRDMQVYCESQFNLFDEKQLLVQSCDEELLAQGMYDYRYPQHQEIIQQWKLEGLGQ